jgi:hypothetical protein
MSTAMPVNPQDALELYADDPRYPLVRRLMHPAIESASFCLPDNADDELLALVTLAALCCGRSVMLTAGEHNRHTQAINRCMLVGQACGRDAEVIAMDKVTVIRFAALAAAA